MVPPFPSLVSQKIISKGFLYETVLGRAFKIPQHGSLQQCYIE